MENRAIIPSNNKFARRKTNNLIELDIGNLAGKSLPSVIEESRRQFKTTATQTELDDLTSLQVKIIQENYVAEKEAMELGFAKEKSELKKAYQDLIDDKNKLISNLAKEKDYLWQEIRYIKDTISSLENTESKELEWDSEWDHPYPNILGKVTKPLVETMAPLSIQEKEVTLCSMMAFRKRTLMKQYKRDKQAILDRVEIEKDLIRDELANDLEYRHSQEIKDLNDTITGLKEALEKLKIQKNELAKIFQGERNALEMGFLRKEQELKEQMARNFQRELVKAHQDWMNSKI